MSNMTIQGMNNTGMAGSVAKAPGNGAGGTGFGEVFTKALESVNNAQTEANTLATGLASGQHANIHETMIALEKAGISFRMAAKVQGKVIDAYREIMRLQL